LVESLPRYQVHNVLVVFFLFDKKSQHDFCVISIVSLLLGPYKAGDVSGLQETEGKLSKQIMTLHRSNQRETKSLT